MCEKSKPNQTDIYLSLVRDIHLAMSSGDDTLRIDIPRMYLKKLELEEQMGISGEQMTSLWEIATQDSPYRV